MLCAIGTIFCHQCEICMDTKSKQNPRLDVDPRRDDDVIIWVHVETHLNVYG